MSELICRLVTRLPIGPIQIAEPRWCRDYISHFARIRRYPKTDHRLIAVRDLSYSPARGIKGADILPALFAIARNDATTVPAPCQTAAATPARRVVIATDARSDVGI